MVEHDQSVRIVRTFNASVDDLFRAWTDAEVRAKWLVPPGWRLSVCTSHPFVGGDWDLVLVDETGVQHRDRGEYATLEPGSLIETSWFYSNATRPEEDASWLKVTFRETAPGKTRQTLVHSRLLTPEQRTGYGQGWAENMDRLAGLSVAAQ